MKTRGKAVVVTGGAGFIGSNLAARLLDMDERVLIVDDLRRPGVAANLDWLMERGGEHIEHLHADVADPDVAREIARRAKVVFHLAGQVAVTTSLFDPLDDFRINAMATVSLLEALRRRERGTPLIFASTNKVYGRLDDVPLVADPDGYQPSDPVKARFGLDETTPLSFLTPYGCSKGAADQYVLDYARSFEHPACVLRMSCIYGPRQMGTEDQGWLAHFALSALQGVPIDIYGDGRQVRDVLYVDDAVEAYIAAWRRIGLTRGRAFNLGGGPANAVSLVRVIRALSDIVDRPITVRYAPWRAGDQRYYVSDVRAVRDALGLQPFRSWRSGLPALVDWLRGRVVRPQETAA